MFIDRDSAASTLTRLDSTDTRGLGRYKSLCRSFLKRESVECVFARDGFIISLSPAAPTIEGLERCTRITHEAHHAVTGVRITPFLARNRACRKVAWTTRGSNGFEMR